MPKKKKKASWPVWVTLVLLLCCFAILLIDWERYPSASEVERYLTATHSDVEKVEVTEIEILEDEFMEGQLYHLKYTYKDGTVAEESFPLRKKDRKAVFPWHDYYSGRYPK